VADPEQNNQDKSPRHATGCDLSRVPKAADVPPADLKTLLSVDSSNPLLRAVRIERGFLKAEDLPAELNEQTPTLKPPAPEEEK
jgi:hypothetical protein